MTRRAVTTAVLYYSSTDGSYDCRFWIAGRSFAGGGPTGPRRHRLDRPLASYEPLKGATPYRASWNDRSRSFSLVLDEPDWRQPPPRLANATGVRRGSAARRLGLSATLGGQDPRERVG